MTEIAFDYEGSTTPMQCRALRGRERVGEVGVFELELIAPETVALREMLGRGCILRISAAFGERLVRGVVFSATKIATTQAHSARLYRVRMTSELELLSLRRRSRVFQHLSTPAILERVLADGGFPAARMKLELADEHAEKEYVVQYDETDLGFVRRMCEEEGLYFRFDPGDEGSSFVLADASPHAPRSREAPLPLVDASGLEASDSVAFNASVRRGLRTGAVTLRDYDPTRPAMRIEGKAGAGLEIEKAYEVYEAPGEARDARGAERRAGIRLESLRADALELSFSTTALELAPGTSFELDCTADVLGGARPSGACFVVGVEHVWKQGEVSACVVTAIPLDVRYRLPLVTPRPRIEGVQTAIVTGAPGEEIHTDEAARVRVRFPWDREGPTDQGSSLPVRALQGNLPGSMLVPRVGWEVLTMFEDADPDRPYVVGRVYNAKQPPPVALPANKSISRFGTLSSPGGKCENAIAMEDGAGRQGLTFTAGSALNRTIANNMLVNTVKHERRFVGATQTVNVGGIQGLSVGKAYELTAPSQSLSVSVTHTVSTAQGMDVKVGSEAVLAGVLLEKVGNLVDGLKNLGPAVFYAGVGYFAEGAAQELAVAASQAVFDSAKATYEHGLASGAMTFGRSALGFLTGKVPGLDGAIAAAEADGDAPWQPDTSKKKDNALQPTDEKSMAKADADANAALKGLLGSTVGGVAGAGAAGPGAAGPGHRITQAGHMIEAIGGAYSVTTPGAVKWTGLAGSAFAVGGDHNTAAGKVSFTTAGASLVDAAALKITAKAKDIKRIATGGRKTTVTGAFKGAANGGDYVFTAGGALKLTASSLALEGGTVVFQCGDSSITFSGGHIVAKSANVKFEAETSPKAETKA